MTDTDDRARDSGYAIENVSSEERWQWAPRLDPECGEYGVFSNRRNELNLGPNTDMIVTGVRVILNNHFAPMPVVGHTYASAQFVGRGSTELSFQVAGIGDLGISALQEMVEELEYNAREFRKIKGAARVTFDNNDFLKLCGIQDGIVSSIDTETDGRGTNLYQCQISFTSDGHHTESFHQEMYLQSEAPMDLLEGMLSRIEATPRRVLWESEIAEALGATGRGNRQFSPNPIINRYRSISNMSLGEQAIFAASGGLIGGPDDDSGLNLTDVNGLVTSTLDAIEEQTDIQTRRFEHWWEGGRNAVNQAALRGDYLEHPIITPRARETADYQVVEDRRFDWVTPYIEELAELLRSSRDTLPCHEFLNGARRGVYRNYRGARRFVPSEDTTTNTQQYPQRINEEGGTTTLMREMAITGTATNLVEQWEFTERRITNWPAILGDGSQLSQMIYGQEYQWLYPTRIETALSSFASQALDLARRFFNDKSSNPDFEEAFPGVVERWITSSQATVHPAYPDLDLPVHPGTGYAIDTEPDYYFWNDSEEGMLNQIGPELVQDLDDRMERAEYSYSLLSDGLTWAETYMGRNRVAPSSLENDEQMSAREERRPMDGRPGLKIDRATQGQDIRDEERAAAPLIGGGPGSANRIPGAGVVDQVLRMSPTVQSNMRDSRLRERREDMLRRTSMSLPTGQGDARGPLGRSGINIGPIDNTISDTDRTHSFSRNHARELLYQSIIQGMDTTLTMRRAFPTFKIYFIEDDTGSHIRHLLPHGEDGQPKPIMYFDDLYNYNSVKSIRLIRSRKNPTDLLILELTNVTGLLERRKWTAPSEQPREPYQPGLEETEFENPLKKLILKEGMKVQCLLGYSNSAYKLGKKFNGEIVELSFNSECSDEVTIICQSYGSELTLEPKGVTTEQQTSFRDTPEAAHVLMCSPELVHFGRFNLNPSFNPAEARSVAMSRNEGENAGYGIQLDPQVWLDQGRDLLCRQRSKWLLANNPADDNIFAPAARDYLTELEQIESDTGRLSQSIAEATDYPDIPWWIPTPILNIALGSLTGGSVETFLTTANVTSSIFGALGRWLNLEQFSIKGHTIWEAFKEMELRHPGWISHPRPYGTRMTMFFGVPSQRYWADQITREEMYLLNRMRTLLEQDWAAREEAVDRDRARRARNPAEHGIRDALGNALSSYNYVEYLYRRTQREITLTNIMTEAGEFLGRTMGRFRPFRKHHLITSDHHILLNNIRANEKGTFNAVNLRYNGGDIYTLKADDSIPDEKTRVEQFDYPSCSNETLARRYCVGLLNRHLKDVYKGEIVVVGMDVDPYDVCFEAGAVIYLKSGVKKIEEVNPKDLVLSHTGNYQEASSVSKRIVSEPGVKIKVVGELDKIKCTQEHPFLIVYPSDLKNRKDISDIEKHWLPAKYLRKDDYVLMPVEKRTDDISADMAYLLGLYLADGFLIYEYRKTEDKKVPVGVGWSLHIDQTRIAERVCSACRNENIRQPRFYDVKNKNEKRIILYNQELAEWLLKTGGRWSHKKELSVFPKNREAALSLLAGYFDGDGCQHVLPDGPNYRRPGLLVATSKSMKLARSVQRLCLMTCIVCNLRISLQREGFRKKGGRRYDTFHEISVPSFYAQYITEHSSKYKTYKYKSDGSMSFFSDGYYVRRISAIERTRPGNRYVYNLQVSKDESFVVNGMAVHNCFIMDDRSSMYGAAEVEQVVDTFTPETGWITEITPDLITGTNEWTTSSTRDARWAVMGALYQRYRSSINTGALQLTAGTAAVGGIAGLATGIGALPGIAAAAAPVAAGAGLAILGGYYVIRWTQDRQPIWVCPLILGDRPMFAGLDGFRQDGIFTSLRGRLHHAVADALEGWRATHLSAFVSDFTIGLAQSLGGQR